MTGNLFAAAQGAGPLLQRDYWAVLAACPLAPSELMAHVKANFCSFPPSTLVQFVTSGPLVTGSLLDIVIRPAQHCGVRVVHEDAQSLTLATVEGHPEAGRITFGAYRNAAGEVILHIRSRARSGTLLKRLGFLAIGDAMQTNTWTDFIRNAAASVGAHIPGVIHADTEQVEETPDDADPPSTPTFQAVGD